MVVTAKMMDAASIKDQLRDQLILCANTSPISNGGRAPLLRNIIASAALCVIITKRFALIVTDFPRISVGPENPLRVEKDDTAQLHCNVDSKPSVTSVKWMRDGRFIGKRSTFYK